MSHSLIHASTFGPSNCRNYMSRRESSPLRPRVMEAESMERGERHPFPCCRNMRREFLRHQIQSSPGGAGEEEARLGGEGPQACGRGRPHRRSRVDLAGHRRQAVLLDAAKSRALLAAGLDIKGFTSGAEFRFRQCSYRELVLPWPTIFSTINFPRTSVASSAAPSWSVPGQYSRACGTPRII